MTALSTSSQRSAVVAFSDSESFVGVVGLRMHALYTELGFHVRSSCWRRGYAVEGATSVLEHAFDTMRLDTIIAGHNPTNVASQRTIERLGFTYTHVGEFEGEPDVMYELRAAPRGARPQREPGGSPAPCG